MKRTAIIIEKNLTSGQAASVSAICMGQAAISSEEIYDRDNLIDLNGVQHAAIRYSSVILKAGCVQLQNLLKNIKSNSQGISIFVFTRTGLSLNNSYEQYKEIITNSKIDDLDIVGIALVGEDSLVRLVTKKFSMLN